MSVSRKEEMRALRRIAQGAPNPFAGAGMDQQPVGIMQLRAEFVVNALIVFAGENIEVSGARPNLTPARRGKQRRLRLRARFPGRDEIEAIGAGRRRAVEQRVDRRLIAAILRRLDPEFAEERKSLVDRAGLDAQRPRGQAISLIAAEKTEIARAEEGNHLVEDMRAR